MSVGTATPSLITGSGANDGLALTSTTTFYVTGTGGLTVAVPLQNGNAGATPSTLIETGAGLLYLTASNNYTGGTFINGGTLQAGNVNALQSTVVTENVSSGSLTFAPGIGTFNLGGLSGSGNIALADVTGGSLTLNVGGNSGTLTTYSGVLSGIGGLNNAGGVLTLTNSNSNYTGPTTITGGALVLANTGVLSAVWSTSGNLTVPAGAAFGIQVGNNPGEFSLGNMATVLGNVGFAASANLGLQVVDAAPFSLTTSISGAQGLTKLGGGTLVLGAANTFTGGTTVTAGVLALANTNALQSSVVSDNLNGGLVFSTSGVTYKIAGLAGGGNLALTNTAGGALTLSLSTAIGATSVYSGVMSGGGGLTVTGSGKERSAAQTPTPAIRPSSPACCNLATAAPPVRSQPAVRFS